MIFSIIGEEHEIYRKFKKDIEETLQWFKDGTISAEEAIDCIQTSVKKINDYVGKD